MLEILNFFGPSTPTMRGLHALLNYLYTKIKKMVCPKYVWMRHCSGTDWEGEIKDFKREGSQKRGDCLKRGDKYPRELY